MKIEQCKKNKCPFLEQDESTNGMKGAWKCTHGGDDGKHPAPGWHPMDAICEAV